VYRDVSHTWDICMCCAVHAAYIWRKNGTSKYDNNIAVIKKKTLGCHFVEVFLC